MNFLIKIYSHLMSSSQHTPPVQYFHQIIMMTINFHFADSFFGGWNVEMSKAYIYNDDKETKSLEAKSSTPSSIEAPTAKCSANPQSNAW